MGYSAGPWFEFVLVCGRLTALWGSWRWRNNAVLGDNDWSVEFVVRWILQEQRDYAWLQSVEDSVARHGLGHVCLRVPPSGACKLNMNGVFSESLNRHGWYHPRSL